MHIILFVLLPLTKLNMSLPIQHSSNLAGILTNQPRKLFAECFVHIGILVLHSFNSVYIIYIILTYTQQFSSFNTGLQSNISRELLVAANNVLSTDSIIILGVYHITSCYFLRQQLTYKTSSPLCIGVLSHIARKLHDAVIFNLSMYHYDKN